MQQLTKHIHAKFQLSSFYPDGLRFFLHFSRKFLNFSEELSSVFLKTSNLIMLIHATTSKAYVVLNVMLNVNFLASTLTDIAKFWTFLSRKFQKFSEIF
jgi:hypothetical protein